MLRYISMELDHGQLQLSLSYACRFDRYYSLPVQVKILLSNCMALPQSNEKQWKFRFTKREVRYTLKPFQNLHVEFLFSFLFCLNIVIEN